MFPERIIKESTFKDFVDKEYLPKHARGKRSERDYKSICKKLVAEFGEKSLEGIERHETETYLNLRYEQVSVYMSNREFAILKGIFTKAEHWKYRREGTNPCRRIKLRKEDPRFRVLNFAESLKLLDTCVAKKGTGLTETKALELRDQIEIALHTGPRKAELLNIKVSDINFDTGMLQILGKGGKTRFVPINARAREILERRVIGRKKYIFGNGNIAPQDNKKAFGSALTRAGIDNCCFHDLRRTFGTRCAMAGVPPKTLQKWMGHSSITTTMKYYVHLPEDYEKEAIERLCGGNSSGNDTSKK